MRDTQTAPNAAFFGVQHIGTNDCWMIEEGNLQSQMGAVIFETAAEAQRFLDTRRLRRGFRARLAVQPIAVETIADMAAKAQEFADSPPLPHGDHNAYWAARAEYLRGFLPLTVH